MVLEVSRITEPVKVTRVMVTGSREFRRMQPIADALSAYRPLVLIHGGARGADMVANNIAVVMNWDTEVFPADWNQHGKAAGSIRNIQMLDEGKPDVVLAFPLAGSRGTWHAVNEAKKRGILTVVFHVPEEEALASV